MQLRVKLYISLGTTFSLSLEEKKRSKPQKPFRERPSPLPWLQNALPTTVLNGTLLHRLFLESTLLKVSYYKPLLTCYGRS